MPGPVYHADPQWQRYHQPPVDWGKKIQDAWTSFNTPVGQPGQSDQVEMPEPPPAPGRPNFRQDINLPGQFSATPTEADADKIGLSHGQNWYPNGIDPSVKNTGTAIYNGPKLNTESALAGLKGAQSTSNFSSGMQQDSGPSTEELYRHAFGDPDSMMPGAGQMAGNQLKSRIGDEDYAQAEQREQLKGINASISAHHPAVQHAAELDALRKAYPSQAQAQGIMGSANINAQSDQNVAEMKGAYDQNIQDEKSTGDNWKNLVDLVDIGRSNPRIMQDPLYKQAIQGLKISLGLQ